ncbi:MAG: acyltransferase [Fimbriimonas ginsengisoli]|uniref:Acyltransferase n=1 Tax=Fimbriimonas ginsengisoli TaxID=1005039 RepID=A0A931PT77_FIMGI|nr:acyltransferase [Fimbriimonas ginsengisoli]
MSVRVGGRHLPALTSLRFFAALHVVLHHHAWLAARQQSTRAGLTGAVFNAVDVGFVAVSFFFVLSGFILAYTYLPQVERGSFSPRGFWLARFARLYPAYFVSLLPGIGFVAAVVTTSGVGFGALLVATKFTMLHAWLPSTARGWNDPTWSLSVEALFYALFPLIVVGVARLPRRGLLPALLGAAFLVFAVCALRAWMDARGIGGLRPEEIDRLFARLPLARLPEFLVGVLLGRHFLESPLSARRAQLGLYGWGALVLVGLAFSRSIPGSLMGSGALLVPFAGLVFCAASADGPMIRLLSARWMVLLGEASYSVYLFHVPVHSLLVRVWRPGLGPLEYGAGLIVDVLAVVLVSIAVYLLVEVPGRRWIRARWGHLPARAVAE